VERETGLEPATFSLEGLSGYALWHPSWEPEHFVSSYRVVVCPSSDLTRARSARRKELRKRGRVCEATVQPTAAAPPPAVLKTNPADDLAADRVDVRRALAEQRYACSMGRSSQRRHAWLACTLDLKPLWRR
jgi:hypothetical protein